MLTPSPERNNNLRRPRARPPHPSSSWIRPRNKSIHRLVSPQTRIRPVNGRAERGRPQQEPTAVGSPEQLPLPDSTLRRGAGENAVLVLGRQETRAGV